jgi:hypothetical protein
MQANTIEDALRLFDPHYPLVEEDDIKAYYVERDKSPLTEIKTILKTDTGFPKVLLSGSPGCGKCTELGKLKQDLKNDFHTILLSAKNFTSNFELNLDGLISKILKEIAEIANKEKLKDQKEKIDEFFQLSYGWELNAEVTISVKGGKGKELLPNTKLLDKFSGEKSEHEDIFKQYSKKTSTPGTGDVINLINETIEEIDLKTKKDVLVLLPDMDKISLKNAKNIFTKSLQNLIKIQCFMVYTFPLPLKYAPDFINIYHNFNGVYYLPNFVVFDQFGNPDEDSKKKLKEIISKRMTGKLIYDEAIDLIVNLCGGVVYELVRLVRESCIVALTEKIKFIDDEVVKEAEERIRRVYNSVYSKKDRKVLLEVRQNKKFINTDVGKKLFKQFSYTEYGTGDDTWYDVNPILFPILEDIELAEE